MHCLRHACSLLFTVKKAWDTGKTTQIVTCVQFGTNRNSTSEIVSPLNQILIFLITIIVSSSLLGIYSKTVFRLELPLRIKRHIEYFL